MTDPDEPSLLDKEPNIAGTIRTWIDRSRYRYSTVWPVGFLRFGEGTLATYGPGSSIIVKFQWNLKVRRPKY